jgi:hypothetical protein
MRGVDLVRSNTASDMVFDMAGCADLFEVESREIEASIKLKATRIWHNSKV